MKKVIRSGGLVLLALLASGCGLFAQSDTAVLFGLVKDPSGASISGAKVVAHNQGTGAQRELETDAKGLFYFTLLPPGGYEIAVEANGFKSYRNPAVQVQVAQVARLDVDLEVGSTSEHVEVSTNASVLNTENAAQGTVISQEKIPSLPLNGRQFLQLALLVPFANAGGRTVQQNTVRQSQVGGLSIAGNRTNNTGFLLDGATNIDPDYNSLNYSPSIDTIAEFQVQAAMVPADFAQASINVVTKSGTNSYHGSAWEFLRNKDLDARPFNLFSDLPKFQRNQFGATVGGPVWKDHLYSFLAYEGLQVRQAGPGLTTVTVPSALQRQGDFSGTPGGIWDPSAPLTNGLRQPFANNQIPASRINPLTNAAMLAIPLPSDPLTNSFVNASGVLSQQNNNYSGRLDYTLTPNWTLFGRYSASDEKATIPATVTGRDGINNALSQSAVLGSTKVISTNMVNETRLSFSRLRIFTGLPELSFDVNGTATKLPQFITTTYPIMGGAGGFIGTTGGGLVLVRDNTYQAYDNLSWNHGRHALRFGGQVEQVQYNRYEAPNLLGTYQFTNGFTSQIGKTAGSGDPLASMLLALPQQGSRSVGPSRIDGRQWIYALYAQDDIHLLPNLTLNLGIRYELAPPLYDIHHQMASIDYSKVPSPQSIFANGPTGFYQPTLFVCGESGYPKGCAYTDKNNFAPRVGLAWAAKPKWVVRAGAGMFYALTDANGLFRLAAGLPDNIAQTLTSNNVTPQFKNLDIFGPAVAGPVQIQAAGIDLNQRTSYSLQWNFSVQHELAPNMVIEAGYLATLGLKLQQNVQPNNAQPGAGAIDPRRPYLGVQYAPGTVFPDYVSVVGNSVPVGFINYLPNSAQSNYHALFARFEKRFSSGFSILSSYTFSKAITNAPQFRNAGGAGGAENSPPQDSYNLAGERGLASFDVESRWVDTFIYDVPVGKRGKYLQSGPMSAIFGDIQVSGIYQMQTGFPFTVNLKGDTAGVGAGTGGIFVRPNAVLGVPVQLSGSQQSTSEWFNTAAFAAPPNFAFGNLGRNTVIGPGLVNLDLVLVKTFYIREGLRLELRAEAFNIANHPNYSVMGRILNDPTFGRVLSQLDPRQLQFGAKVVF
jgi:hypothetical protein